jgi:ribosomal protein L14
VGVLLSYHHKGAVMVENQKTNQHMADNSDQSEEISAQTIIEVVKEGSQVYSEITASFVQEFVFYDKTLYEWATDLIIKIPNARDLDEISYRDLLIQLANNIQLASNYHSVASSMADAVSGGNSIKKSDVVNAIVMNFKKQGARRPAATVIERMADSYMSSTVSARVAAKIVKNFWKQRLDTLLEVRKILEQIGMSLHVEMKWTSQ